MSKLDKLLRLKTGTSFKGYLLAQYDDIIATFGQPSRLGDGNKTDVEWILMTPYGVATIYNYKDGKSYLGDKGLETTLITKWHIGGKDDRVASYIKSKINHHIIRRLS